MARKREITTLLKTRIRQGDYRVRPFPSTASLAAELKIDRRTASKAMSELIQRGLLLKTETGRVRLAMPRENEKRTLAMLAPAYPSITFSGRFSVIEQLANRRGWDIKLIGYHHAQDPAIFEAIDRFDALFLVPNEDEFSQDAIAKLKATGTKAVTFFADHTRQGIPSLRSENALSTQKLLDHLYDVGHRSVACLNTQPAGDAMQGRIRQWQAWKQARGIEGGLIDRPVEHGGSAMAQARSVARECLKDGSLKVDAVYCTTGPAAIGLMRAMADLGLTPGRDLAVCSADDSVGAVAEYLSPSLTHLRPPQETPYFETCLDWFADDESPWLGPLLVQIEVGELFVGESTQRRQSL